MKKETKIKYNERFAYVDKNGCFVAVGKISIKRSKNHWVSELFVYFIRDLGSYRFALDHLHKGIAALRPKTAPPVKNLLRP